jgi:hypothetical protein
MAVRMSRVEVASLLSVPDAALDLVTLLDEPCTTQGCNNLGIKGNCGGRCAFHSQSWFPQAKDKQNNLRTNRRGYELLGPEYQRNFGTKKPAMCCCNLEVCVGIGYSHHGMFRLPTEQVHLSKFLEKLPVSLEKKALIKESPRNHHVAPWHFSPVHRKRDDEGKWSFRQRDDGVYFDGDRKRYAFPPPNYNPRDFIAEVRLTKRGIERTCTPQKDLLSLPAPLWFSNMQRGGNAAAVGSQQQQRETALPIVITAQLSKL